MNMFTTINRERPLSLAPSVFLHSRVGVVRSLPRVIVVLGRSVINNSPCTRNLVRTRRLIAGKWEIWATNHEEAVFSGKCRLAKNRDRPGFYGRVGRLSRQRSPFRRPRLRHADATNLTRVVKPGAPRSSSKRRKNIFKIFASAPPFGEVYREAAPWRNPLPMVQN